MGEPPTTARMRVDRLLVEDSRVLVADFKTNRPAPDTIEAADPAYLRQMAVSDDPIDYLCRFLPAHDQALLNPPASTRVAAQA